MGISEDWELDLRCLGCFLHARASLVDSPVRVESHSGARGVTRHRLYFFFFFYCSGFPVYFGFFALYLGFLCYLGDSLGFWGFFLG